MSELIGMAWRSEALVSEHSMAGGSDESYPKKPVTVHLQKGSITLQMGEEDNLCMDGRRGKKCHRIPLISSHSIISISTMPQHTNYTSIHQLNPPILTQTNPSFHAQINSHRMVSLRVFPPQSNHHKPPEYDMIFPS